MYYRPEWTAGTYNERKHVAIMYNLIAGYSFYFESLSADVIGLILSSGRNGSFSIEDVSKQTGIAGESIQEFLDVLRENGLVTSFLPNAEDVNRYRTTMVEYKHKQGAWVDLETSEKMPMDISDAENLYFEAIDDGSTVGSCMFELTYRCSEICIHCYNPGAIRNSDEVSHRADYNEMNLEDYKRVIDELIDLGLVKVCLTGGDPFSKEFVWDLLDYLYSKDVVFDIFTNGQRIVNDVKRLADYYPRLVGISIYSGVPEDHDAITRIPGSWKKSMSVVRDLSKLAVPMNLKCCVMQPNLHSYYMVADIAREYGAQPQFELNITESNDGDVCAKGLRLTEEQLHVVLRDSNMPLYVGKEARDYGGIQKDLTRYSCGAGHTSFCISPNGDIRACVSFTQVYGNLLNTSARDILVGSNDLKAWRNAVIGDFPECGRHDYCDYCSLCAGLNYAEHGDFRIAAESNCFMAKCRFNLARKLREGDEPLTRENLIKKIMKLPVSEPELKRSYNKG